MTDAAAIGDPGGPSGPGASGGADGPGGPGGPDDLYERLAVHVGRVAAAGGEGKDPVNGPMIRHWCEAIGHPVPADGSAPATMLQVWTMGGLSGHSAGTARAGAYDEVLTLLDAAGCTSVVATDCEQEYLRPLRPGDRITYDAVIESISPRKTTKLGTGHFVTTRMDVRADGELCGTHRFRILKYAPAAAGRPAQAAPRRPRPVVNRDNAGYWEGLERHELLIQRCRGCGTLRLPWLPGCNACGSPDWDTVPAAGDGTVFSHVVMHHPPFPAFDPPYAVALVELAEGVRVLGNVTGVPYDKVRAGRPVTLEFRTVDGEFTLPVFRPVDGGQD